MLTFKKRSKYRSFLKTTKTSLSNNNNKKGFNAYSKKKKKKKQIKWVEQNRKPEHYAGTSSN